MSRTLLAIETSCDETAAAVVDETLSVRSSVVASQIFICRCHPQYVHVQSQSGR